jgi:hypothetical protein
MGMKKKIQKQANKDLHKGKRKKNRLSEEEGSGWMSSVVQLSA